MSKILGVKIDEYSLDQVIRKITYFLNSKTMHQIVTVNPEFIVGAQKDPLFKKILNEADLSVADGFGLKIVTMLTNEKIGERITGVDLTWQICRLASEKKYSVFFLGGDPGVGKKTADTIKKSYPQLKIAGYFSGKPKDQKTIDVIKKSNPDILLVAFGAPKQDKFIYNLKTNYLNLGFKNANLPRVAMGVGGTFDYISGLIPRAPKWMRTLGLEWLYRLIRQPSRINRIYTAVIKFPLMVLFKG